MARFALVYLLLFTLAGVTQANPLEHQLSLVQSDGTVHATNSWSWDNCGLEDDVVQVKSVVVSPDPPSPGDDLTVEVNAYVQKTIEEGAYADVVVKLGLIKLLQRRFDVCEEARNANATITCPVKKGDLYIKQTVALPKEIPKAKFVVNVRGFTVDEDDMVCVNLKVDFMKHPFFKLGW